MINPAGIDFSKLNMETCQMVDPAPSGHKALDIGTETGNRPIDLVYLARQTLGDPALEAEILVLFAKMAKSYVDRVTDSLDGTEIAHGLHALKGAAAGIGAAAIAMEAAAAEAELQETGRLSAERMGDLSIAVEETLTFIDHLLVE